MSLYSDYIKELDCKDVIETDFGFIIYRVVGTECHVEDIYLSPSHRKKGEASKLCDAVVEAVKGRCSMLFGFINMDAKTSNESLRAQLSYGFKLHSLNQGRIVLYKEI